MRTFVFSPSSLFLILTRHIFEKSREDKMDTQCLVGTTWIHSVSWGQNGYTVSRGDRMDTQCLVGTTWIHSASWGQHGYTVSRGDNMDTQCLVRTKWIHSVSWGQHGYTVSRGDNMDTQCLVRTEWIHSVSWGQHGYTVSRGDNMDTQWPGQAVTSLFFSWSPCSFRYFSLVRQPQRTLDSLSFSFPSLYLSHSLSWWFVANLLSFFFFARYCVHWKFFGLDF